MGQVIALFTSQGLKTRNAGELLELALCELTREDPFRGHFNTALRQVLDGAQADLSHTRDQLDHLDYFLTVLNENSSLQRQEAFLVSLMRLHRDTGWDLLADERIRSFARRGPRLYLTYLNVLGVIALAWQVKRYGNFGIILEEAVFRQHYPPTTKKPRSA